MATQSDPFAILPPATITYSSGAIGKIFLSNDPAGNSDIINVPDTCPIIAVRVMVNITHPKDQDVDIFLDGPRKISHSSSIWCPGP